MRKSRFLSVLDKYDFIVDKSEVFMKDQNEYIYCYNHELNIGFIIKEYQKCEEHIVLNDVFKARSLLKEQQINIWNTYFIILLDKIEKQDALTDQLYMLERNPKGLRKYLIITEEDIKRIPFLSEDEKTLPLDFISNIDQFLQTGEKEVDKLIKWIISEEENYIGVKRNKIKEKVNELLLQENVL